MLVDILRWIAVVVAVYYVPTLLLAVLLRVALALGAVAGTRSGGAVRDVFTVISYFIFGAVLVLLAVWIAPNYKEIVAVIALLYSISEAWRRCMMYRAVSHLAYPIAIARVVGSLVAVFIL